MAGLTRVMLTCPGQGSIWRYSVELAHGLVAAGVEPVLAVLGNAARPAEAASEGGAGRVVDTGLPDPDSAESAEAMRSIGAALAGLAGRLNVDTVHLHTPALAAEVAWPVPVVAVAHDDLAAWWHAVHGTGLPEPLAWRASAVAHGLAEADAVVAPSRSFCRALIRAHRPGRSFSVIPPGRSHLPPPPNPRRSAVLSVARLWDPAANMAVLDRAAAALAAPVLAAGPVEGPDGAVAAFQHLTLLGHLPHAAVLAQMAATSVFVAPARYAPFGLAVLAAAQSGMALALADIPGFRELWDGAALFFHPDDAGALADALDRLLQRPEAAAARAQRHAERYSASAMVAATLALHRPLAARRAA